MKFTVTKWNIKKLFDTYKKGNLTLSPPYQRNFIWSINDQRYLIDSIKKNNPIPNFFLLEKERNKFEMVDGQQRSRTILSFLDLQFEDMEKRFFSADRYPDFWNYEFPVTIITDVEGESIERFYAIVNKTGVHLNKPEVRKADYYDTVFLSLVNELISSKKFKSLKIFTDSSLKRMNDMEFVSELIVLLEEGHIDKKNHLDEYFENDITKSKAAEIKGTFNIILDKINRLNDVREIVKTRYKQRNDFYTLVDFINKYPSINDESLIYFYKILVAIGIDIKPSQEKCIPLQEYARNCVTQSNSKAARDARLLFFEQLLVNTNKTPNKTQKEILSFYGLRATSVIKKQNFLTIDFKELNKEKNISFE